MKLGIKRFKDFNNIFFSKKTDSRNVSVRNNIVGLIFIKGTSIGINFLLIPLTLGILDDYRYGIWITIFNLLSWINIFDIGIGNGLRNKYTECIAKNDFVSAKKYVSTSYVILFFVALSFVIMFFISCFFVDWINVFNAKEFLRSELSLLISITFVATCVQFILKLISTILIADHKSAFASLLSVISNLLITIILLFVNKLNLYEIGIVYVSCPLITFLVAHGVMFSGRYNNVKPEIKFYDRSKVRSLFGLGMKFFFIQIATLIIFQTDNFIILHKLSPEFVTPYNIAFKYFSVVPMLYGIIATPLWNAYTDAAARKDISWIKNTLLKQLFVVFFFILLSFILFLLSSYLIKYWIGKELNLSFELLVGMLIYSIISVWNGVFSAFLGGISKVRLITFVTIFSAFANIPLSLFLIDYLGGESSGVIFATILCVSITAFIGPFQAYYFVFSKRKSTFLDKVLS